MIVTNACGIIQRPEDRIVTNIRVSQIGDIDVIFFDDSVDRRELMDQFPYDGLIRISCLVKTAFGIYKGLVEGYPNFFSIDCNAMCLTPEPIHSFDLGGIEHIVPLNSLVGGSGYIGEKGVRAFIGKISSRIEIKAQIEQDDLIGPAMCLLDHTFSDSLTQVFPPGIKVRVYPKNRPELSIEGFPSIVSNGAVYLLLLPSSDSPWPITLDRLIPATRKNSSLCKYGQAELVVEKQIDFKIIAK